MQYFRYLCGASVAYTKKLSHFISSILRPLWKNDDNACTSTEEMLAAIKALNERNIEGKLIVGSADVDKLYPSIDVDFAARAVADTFKDSNMKLENVKEEDLGLYLALNLKYEELLQMNIAQYCPTRKNRVGAPPVITGCATQKSREARMKPWNPPIRVPDEETLKKMFGEALRIIITFIMKNHLYKFDSKIKKQAKGGAIGLELTGDVAQICMMWFDQQLKQKIEDQGLCVLLYKRYVDDINMVLQVPNRDDNENIEDDAHWMSIVKDNGNRIHPSTQITVDYPSKHDDKKMPILDLKVWLKIRNSHNQDNTPNLVVHEFYYKEVATRAVTHARSAMPLSMKRTTLTLELLRIMLRCSPELGWAAVIPHLDHAMLRMQYSGYDKQFKAETLKSALKAYKEIVKKDRNGTQPMYRD